MKIYSYTDSSFSAPAILFDVWPVPYLKGYAEFLRHFSGVHVYHIHDEHSDTWIPLQVRKAKIFSFGQILCAPCSDAKELSPAKQKEFFNTLLPFLRSSKLCQRLQQPHPMGMTLAVPGGAASCVFGTYVNELQEPDAEQLLFTFDPKYRKAVQHSIKNGGRVEFGEKVFNDFYKLYTATTSRAGIYTDSPEFFHSQMKYMQGHTDIGVVYDENGPIGGIYMLWSKYSALCTHAGSGGVESKLYGGMKHLHYAMMLRMKERGVKWYDLVGVRIGSTNAALQGVFRFKKGFGGMLREGYLWKTDLSPLPRIYDLMLLVKNRGKRGHGDIIDQERGGASEKPVEHV